MSLVFKKAKRDNLSKLDVYIEDTSTTSPNYFRVADVPQVLQKGKNLLRISAHPTNLEDNSQIYIDVRDSNGNAIYFEIPEYIEEDKSRVISIWIYHDKGDDNTANGDATITLVGTTKVDDSGRVVPDRFRNKPNVRWSTVVNVDRNRTNTSPVIFRSDLKPTIVVSESIESYVSQSQSGRSLSLTTQTGTQASYIYKGSTPIVKISDGTEFNNEMIGYDLQLDNFTNPATPQTSISNPTDITSYTSSIVRLIDSTTAVLESPFTTTFDNRDGLLHTFTNIDSSDYSISYFQTGSNTSTGNERSFANITLSNVDPAIGVVDKIKVLIKSDGLPGEYELLNEVTVPYSSSFTIKVPVPSEHLRDARLIKLQYLNSIGEISRTESTTDPFVFQGGNLFIQQRVGDTTYTLFDSTNGAVDGRNIGRQLVSDSTEYTLDNSTTLTEVVSYIVTLLPLETNLGISLSMKVISTATHTGTTSFYIQGAQTGSGKYDDFDSEVFLKSAAVPSNVDSGEFTYSPEHTDYIVDIPTELQGRLCKIIVKLLNSGTATVGNTTKVKNISIISTRTYGADFSSKYSDTAPQLPSELGG
jgi:hypothetical protein